MQVSQSAGNALHGLLYLHIHGDERPIQLHAIAKGLKVSESYLSKIFQTLAKSSLVSSFRGAKGGFILVKPAQEISLREVIEMIDGQIVQAKCCIGRPDCNERDKCTVFHRIYDLQRTIYDALENIAIIDLNTSFFQPEKKVPEPAVRGPERDREREAMG